MVERVRERGENIDGDDSGRPRHCTDAIEEALYQHRKSPFGTISVACFDTTSLHFEGQGGATLGQLGHFKDSSARSSPRSCWNGDFASIEAGVRQLHDERITEHTIPENDLAGAKPYVDEALADIARGKVLTLDKHRAPNAARVAALKD